MGNPSMEIAPPSMESRRTRLDAFFVVSIMIAVCGEHDA